MTVRKAASLKTLDELHLSKETMRTCRYMPVDSLVSTARHQYHCTPKNSEHHDWLDEVKEALDRNGFIRHDFDATSFAMGRLYQAVSHAYADASFVTGFYDLIPNEKYENYRNLTKQEKDTILSTLDKKLNELEAKVIKLYFGLEPGTVPMEAEEIAGLLKLSKADVRLAYMRALKILWYPGVLPKVHQFTTE